MSEAERQACEIRLRAERRAGQLLSELEKAKGSPGNQYTGPLPRQDRSNPPTLAELGVSPNQSSRWQKLASVSETNFEATFARSEKPSTTGMIREHDAFKPRAQATVDPRALWLWGRVATPSRPFSVDAGRGSARALATRC
jgi:hypothetical protein